MIEVSLPDGSIAEFPDGTPHDVMTGAISSHLSPSSNDNSLSRAAGRTLRAGVKGWVTQPIDLATAPVRTIFNAANSFFGGDPNYLKSYDDMAEKAFDAYGVGKANTPMERTLDSGASMLAGVGPFIKAGQLMSNMGGQVASGVGSALADMPVMQGVSGITGGIASGGARELNDSPLAQAIAGVIGGIAPIGAVNAASGAKNTLAGLINTEKARAFKSAGYTPPSLGTISDSGPVQALEGGLRQLMPSSGVMKRAYESGNNILSDVIENSAEKMAGGASVPRSLEAMGDAAASGATTSKDAFRNASRQFENTVYAPLGQLSASLDNVLQFIDAQASTYSPAVAEAYRARMLKELGPILDDATPRLTIQGKPITPSELQAQPYLQKMATEEPGGLNVASLRDWRGRIGEKMDTPGVATTSDATQAELRALYGNASKDIENALPPDGLAQVQGYNKWYSGESGIRKNVEDVFFGKKDSTATAKAILSADAEQLAQLRHVVGDDVFNQLRAGALREISRGQGGGFSSEYTLKALSGGRSGLQDSSRQALFQGEDESARAIAQALSESKNAANTSNTAGANWVNTLLGGGALAGAFFQPVKTAAAVATPWAAAKAVTSPKVLNSLIERAFNPISVQPGNMLNLSASPINNAYYGGERAKESYADMLRRYGVNITLGQ